MTTFVIPAAGLGSRMQQVDHLKPKPLLDVAGFTMLDLVIRNLRPSADDLVIVIGRQGQGLSDWHPTTGLHAPFQYLYKELEKLSEGPAITVLSALPFVREDEAVIVANSDQYVMGGIRLFAQRLANMNEGGLLLTMWATGERWSYVKTRGRAVVEVAEKREISEEATVGVYGWTSKEVLSLALSQGLEEDFRVSGEFYVAPTYNALIRAGLYVEAINCGKLERGLVGLGTPDDFYAALRNQRFLQEIRKFEIL